MDKRYQVFVSSTYADLQDERQEVMQALLELDCIPAGMELFPAANEDQWTLIKKVIDDCDYYIVILAGRYGSIGPSDLSFTEMEYRYALEIGKPAIGFVHRDPGAISVGRCEITDAGKAKLNAFRELVQKKMCRFWDSPADLGSQVSRSVVKLIKSHPGVGWVRGNLVLVQAAAEEILALRRKVEEAEATLQATRTTGPAGSSELAQGDDLFELRYTFIATSTGYRHDGKKCQETVALTWNDIFSYVSPLLIDELYESEISDQVSNLIYAQTYKDLKSSKSFASFTLMEFRVGSDDFQTIKIQLRALGLITKSQKSRSVKDTATYWTLTPYGDTVMTRLRAIRKSSL